MGAYSPALVVGDGAIGFSGTQSVTALMNTLEGAAANQAATNGAANAAPAAAAPATPAPAAAVVPDTPVDVQLLEGMGKSVVTREEEIEEREADKEVEKRDLAGFNAALSYATGALKTSPEVQLGTGEGGSGVGITQKAGGTTSNTTRTG